MIKSIFFELFGNRERTEKNTLIKGFEIKKNIQIL